MEGDPARHQLQGSAVRAKRRRDTMGKRRLKKAIYLIVNDLCMYVYVFE